MLMVMVLAQSLPLANGNDVDDDINYHVDEERVY